MEVVGNYRDDGYALIKGLVPVEVAQAFMLSVKREIGDAPVPINGGNDGTILLRRPGFEFHGNDHLPSTHFLWALTPSVSALAGTALLPTYSYFRIYRQGDICRVHSDRFACEHSVSLTLALSDGRPWSLEVSHRRDDDNWSTTEDFGGDGYGSICMSVGDAALYRGVSYPHGRVTPNPNRWSAHLFLHYVERDGAHAGEAFDKHFKPADVDFDFS
jgi:hypothetical protein